MTQEGWEPSQIAAALAKEIDAGFAAALMSTEASGALVVDRIVARVSSLPKRVHEPAEWSSMIWQGEVVLLPGEASQYAGSSEGETGEAPDPADKPMVQEIAQLPVAAIQGVGPVWVSKLDGWGIRAVGELAGADLKELADAAGAQWGVLAGLIGRAKTAVTPFAGKVHPADVGMSILALAREGIPETAGTVYAAALRNYALALVSVVDIQYVAELRLR